MVMKADSLKKSLLLFLAALIWGVAFVAQSEAVGLVEPFTFNCVRNILGSIVLLPVIYVMGRCRKETDKAEISGKATVVGGILCGVVLGTASALQQIGIEYTTAGKAGFITAFYIVLVPVAGIFLKKKCGLNVWISVLLAITGLGLLCLKDDFSVGKGEIYVFLCAIMFTIHILVIDHFGAKADSVKMSCIQFATVGVLSGIVMLIFEKPDLGNILKAWLPIVYTGVFSSGVAYTLQIVGQKGMNPTVASLILSLESVVSVIAGFIILKQELSGRELLGCVVMFAAIILVQLSPAKDNKK